MCVLRRLNYHRVSSQQCHQSTMHCNSPLWGHLQRETAPERGSPVTNTAVSCMCQHAATITCSLMHWFIHVSIYTGHSECNVQCMQCMIGSSTLGMDGYPAPASGSGRFSTNRWNPPPVGLYVARRVGFSRITVPRFALSPMSLRN